MASEGTTVTAIHNIKSNKGQQTAGVDGAKMDRIPVNAKKMN